MIFRKIRCPVDFSNSSIAALDQAAMFARKDDALLLSHMVLGSVAERTIRESSVPVLTVRGGPSVA